MPDELDRLIKAQAADDRSDRLRPRRHEVRESELAAGSGVPGWTFDRLPMPRKPLDSGFRFKHYLMGVAGWERPSSRRPRPASANARPAGVRASTPWRSAWRATDPGSTVRSCPDTRLIAFSIPDGRHGNPSGSNASGKLRRSGCRAGRSWAGSGAELDGWPGLPGLPRPVQVVNAPGAWTRPHNPACPRPPFRSEGSGDAGREARLCRGGWW